MGRRREADGFLLPSGRGEERGKYECERGSTTETSPFPPRGGTSDHVAARTVRAHVQRHVDWISGALAGAAKVPGDDDNDDDDEKPHHTGGGQRK